MGLRPTTRFTSELTGVPVPNVLTSALNQLDAFPALMWRNGRPVLENGQHEEIAVERKVGTRGFCRLRDSTTTTATLLSLAAVRIFSPPNICQDFDSKGFAYDGGHSSAWGARVALRERISDDLEFTTIYAFSGALVPTNDAGRRAAGGHAHGIAAVPGRQCNCHEFPARAHASMPATSGSTERRYPAWTPTAKACIR